MKTNQLRNSGRQIVLSGFTLAELVVVIAILAVLATVGFLALSGYRDDARVTSMKANVRSVYTAIAAESAVTGNSPRSYVKHDPDYALSGALVVIEGNSSNLVGGNWDQPGTNYSAGNPDFKKLRLDPEKFNIAEGRIPSMFRSVFAESVSDASLPIVGAADIKTVQNGKERSAQYVQVTAILPSNIAYVSGDFPVSGEESAAGLVRDAKNPSSTGALVDGAPTGAPAPCGSATLSGYSVPPLESGKSTAVTKSVDNGALSAKAVCSFGKLSVYDESIACGSGYVPSGEESCVADVCGGSAPGTDIPNAQSNAVAQTVSSNWHYSENPGICTFSCTPGRTWDGNVCRASCEIPAAAVHQGLSYALGELSTVVHGQSADREGSHVFGSAPSNGTLTADFTVSCNDGTVSVSSVSKTSTCPAGHLWNSSWTSPVCNAALNGTCGTAGKTYPYSASAFGSDALCSQGNPVPGNVVFPSAGGSATWKCSGLFGGADSDTCIARRGSCDSAPTFANVGTLAVGDPTSVGTAWTYSATPANCTYACSNGYLGSGCTVSGIVGNDTDGRKWANGTYAPSCKAYKNPSGSYAYSGATGDGTYWIDPDGAGSIAAFKVLCDMTTDGGGWTIIANSFANAGGDSSTKPFNLTWSTAKTAGVGTMTSATSNFHISMDKYVAMANSANTVDYAWYAKSGKAADAWQRTLQYSSHYLSSDGSFTWNGTSSYALNSLVAYNGIKLSTYDADNDQTSSNCASAYGSFGWYTACHGAHFWSMTDERSTTCNPSSGLSGTSHNRGGTAVCNGYSNNGPDAAGAYNTWYQLKIMIR